MRKFNAAGLVKACTVIDARTNECYTIFLSVSPREMPWGSCRSVGDSLKMERFLDAEVKDAKLGIAGNFLTSSPCPGMHSYRGSFQQGGFSL